MICDEKIQQASAWIAVWNDTEVPSTSGERISTNDNLRIRWGHAQGNTESCHILLPRHHMIPPLQLPSVYLRCQPFYRCRRTGWMWVRAVWTRDRVTFQQCCNIEGFPHQDTRGSCPVCHHALRSIPLLSEILFRKKAARTICRVRVRSLSKQWRHCNSTPKTYQADVNSRSRTATRYPLSYTAVNTEIFRSFASPVLIVKWCIDTDGFTPSPKEIVSAWKKKCTIRSEAVEQQGNNEDLAFTYVMRFSSVRYFAAVGMSMFSMCDVPQGSADERP